MSDLIQRLESDPFESVFSPSYFEYQCIATHSATLNSEIKRAILNSENDAKSIRIAIEYILKLILTI